MTSTLDIRHIAAIIAVAAAALALGGASYGASDARSEASARTGAAVYVKGLDRKAEIYVKRAGIGERRITRNAAYDGFPSWSEDGKRIVFVSDRANRGNSDIYVMDANGKNVARLTRGGGQDLYPAFSPDGRRIVFSTNRDGAEPEVYVVGVDGKGLRRLTRTAKYVEDVTPRFSPDGRWIVFSSNRVAFANYEIFRMRATDGGGIKRLTFHGGDVPGDPGDDLLPSYSPDGKRIVFVSDRAPRYGIWTMNADGGDLRKLVSYENLNVAFPRYSPDGNQILYTVFSPERDLSDAQLRMVLPASLDDAEFGAGREGDW